MGIIHTTALKILWTSRTQLRAMNEAIQVNSVSVQVMLGDITKTLPPEANLALDAPITTEELKHVIQKGKPNKAPGCDGISHDFYRATWDRNKDDMLTVINQMYVDGMITEAQKRGMLVCIPKTQHPQSPEDYRPLTLLNADYKLLASSPLDCDRGSPIFCTLVNIVVSVTPRYMRNSPKLEMP
jgi:hypothetical protein